MERTCSDAGLQFINAEGKPDVLPLGELKSVELTPNCSFQDYAGRPTHPSDKRPWIQVYQHRDTTDVYDAIRRITLKDITLPEQPGHYWTTLEELAMDVLRECYVPRAYWAKFFGRSRTSVERKAKQLYG